MAYGKEVRVRKSIASSIAEIANIIGVEKTEKELVPILDKLYKEDGEIQNTIMRNIPKFCKNLDKNLRKNYLDKLKKMLDPREKWRTRQEFCKIIGEYANVFDDETTYKQVFPINLHFCLDDVDINLIKGCRS